LILYIAGMPKYVALRGSLICLSVIYFVSLIGGIFLNVRSVKMYPEHEINVDFLRTRDKRPYQDVGQAIGSSINNTNRPYLC
jgi:hypothetical protein